MKQNFVTIRFLYLLFLIVSFSCKKYDGENTVTYIEGELAGGETTVYLSNSQAFGEPAPNLSNENYEKHADGDKAFESIFVSNPAPTHGGLGPVFNNTSCNSCHPSDGRASVPADVNTLSGFFLRISIPGTDEHGGPNPAPNFGTQLQHQALYGYQAEAQIKREYEKIEVELSDGTTVTLQKPTYSIIDAYTSLPENVQISPRIAMPVFGLGLLEAIPEEVILANVDEDDINGDGISGKANYVWDPVTESFQLGRFGWKAGTSSVLVQAANAYSEDMGLTTTINPIESSYGQTNGDPNSISPEVSDEELEDVAFYCKTLGVPATRNFEEQEVIQGSEVFRTIGCDKCHTHSFTTGNYDGIPAISHQKIYPYTDMLLHDMGEGLADHRTEFMASGTEWKTRPLWGIGLTNVTNGHTSFLHDGRARNITEAILWHGGEAKAAHDDFIELSTEDREALLAFVNAL